VTRCDPPLVDPVSRRDYTDFVTAAFKGARPTVASALARAIPRGRFAGLARELGFGADALPSQLDVHQWAGLFRAAGPVRGGTLRGGPSQTGPSRGGASGEGASRGTAAHGTTGRGVSGRGGAAHGRPAGGGSNRGRRRTGDRPAP
jgi:hypothetical protein